MLVSLCAITTIICRQPVSHVVISQRIKPPALNAHERFCRDRLIWLSPAIIGVRTIGRIMRRHKQPTRARSEKIVVDVAARNARDARVPQQCNTGRQCDDDAMALAVVLSTASSVSSSSLSSSSLMLMLLLLLRHVTAIATQRATAAGLESLFLSLPLSLSVYRTHCGGTLMACGRHDVTRWRPEKTGKSRTAPECRLVSKTTVVDKHTPDNLHTQNRRACV